jgi:hypothetical protein
MNRRQLLLRGALLAALAPVVGASPTAAQRLIAVHDPAYRRSHQFAQTLQQQGAQVLALSPDALAIWHRTLKASCAQSPASARIAGLTTFTDFIVLRDLARAEGLAPMVVHDPDARDARIGQARRATLIAWVLAPRSTVA